MDRLRCMEIFIAAVEAGNFSSAAERLDVSAVTVGKHIQHLEEHLRTRLLNRSTRRQNLTAAGSVFYEQAQVVLKQFRLAEELVESLEATPRGLLRVSAPDTLGSSVIAPLLASYSREHPDVHVELVLDNERVDLIKDRFELAIRIGPLEASQLVARPLRPYRMVICASPAYLARAGAPQTVPELGKHCCLGHLAFKGQHTWHVGQVEYAWPSQTRMSTNDGHALRAAAIAGAGIIIQPEVLLADDIRAGRLVSILESFLPPPRPVHLVYLYDSKPRRRLMSLVHWVLREFGM